MALVGKLLRVLKIPQNYYASVPGTQVWKEANVVDYLWKWNPHLDTDNEGNLFILNPGKPLICVHMDTVQTTWDTTKIKEKGLLIKDGIIKSGGRKDAQSFQGGILGGDDRCGVALAMELYETYGDNISILFTTGEETGMDGIREFVKTQKEFIDTTPYCLVLDRMGKGDIIGYNNQYCSMEFQNEVHELMKPFGYAPATGIGCDANVLRTYMNCVNLSVGYYNHHQNSEHINISEYKNSFEAICFLLENLEGEYPIYYYKAAKNWNDMPRKGGKKNKQTSYPSTEIKQFERPLLDSDEYYEEQEAIDRQNQEDTITSESKETGKLFTINTPSKGVIVFHEPVTFYSHFKQKTITIPPGEYLFYEDNGQWKL